MPLKVLISGAGIAGPAAAYWLTKAGATTTVVERSSALRDAGQQIDIRGAGLQVVRRMGLEEKIASKTVKEAGLAVVDTIGIRKAEFPVTADGASFTTEIEIQRGDLVQIFYEVSKDDTEYIFGDHVTAVEEKEDSVKVTLASGAKRDFDLVIAADGMGSKVRRLVFPDVQPLRPLGQYMAYFSIPFLEKDGGWAEWYNAPGGRSIVLRPDRPTGLTRTYLSIMSTVPAGHEKLGIAGQKQMMNDLFAGAGWEAERVLEAMPKADDFYMQEIAQVKMNHWSTSKGRVALLGDAAFYPSPISGQGTTMAILGAYILAGEISKSAGNLKEALSGYERVMRVFVDKAQSLPPGFPALANPQTRFGITVFHVALRIAAWTNLISLLSWFSRAPAADKFLPLYDI